MNNNQHPDDVSARIRSASGYLFDLDGSLVLGDKNNRGLQALPGAAELLALLDKRNTPYRVMTNGTVKTPAKISTALAEAGLTVPAEKIMTPSTVAADYFLRRSIRKIMVLGIEGVWQPIADAGLKVVRPLHDGDTEDSDAIFIGWYREISMNEIEAACDAVWNGAGLFAASMVPFFATRHGRALGSSRAISAMITSITGRRATPLGKPSLHALRDAARHIGCNTSDLVVVGDDPDLEVRMALNGKALAVAVQTGIADANDFAALAPDRRPHLCFASVAELGTYLANLE